MSDRFMVPGNSAPNTDPEPGIPGPNEGTRNASAYGGWPNVGDNGRFAADGNPAPGSNPLPTDVDPTDHEPMGMSWPPAGDRFRADGNPPPRTDPQPRV